MTPQQYNKAKSIARAFTLQGIERQLSHHKRSLHELDLMDASIGDRGKRARDCARQHHREDIETYAQALQLKLQG